MKLHTHSAQRGRHLMAALGLALASALAGGAYAQGGPGPDRGTMMGPGPGGPMMGYGAFGGPGGPGGRDGMFQGMLPRMLDRVNATPEQRAQIQKILQASADDLRAQHEAGRALRDQALALFAQPTVDPAAVEAMRQKQLAQHDAASKRMMTAMLDISRVLTPEQRKQMVEQMAQRREMMQRHWRERQSLDAPKPR
jgi:Spy/CpxP family protein refolding chaperone